MEGEHTIQYSPECRSPQLLPMTPDLVEGATRQVGVANCSGRSPLGPSYSESMTGRRSSEEARVHYGCAMKSNVFDGCSVTFSPSPMSIPSLAQRSFCNTILSLTLFLFFSPARWTISPASCLHVQLETGAYVPDVAARPHLVPHTSDRDLHAKCRASRCLTLMHLVQYL